MTTVDPDSASELVVDLPGAGCQALAPGSGKTAADYTGECSYDR